jgi:hypothetical protein
MFSSKLLGQIKVSKYSTLILHFSNFGKFKFDGHWVPKFCSYIASPPEAATAILQLLLLQVLKNGLHKVSWAKYGMGLTHFVPAPSAARCRSSAL